MVSYLHIALCDLGTCLWLKAPDLVKSHWLRMQNATKTLSVSWFQPDSILILLDMYNKDPKINNVYSNTIHLHMFDSGQLIIILQPELN